ncbi:MAG: hypothetical protein JXA92_11610 [candidate division Zixibacteria bacterium]|nr:hypothetical protein [candidate division Zixibacteria bacterium]
MHAPEMDSVYLGDPGEIIANQLGFIGTVVGSLVGGYIFGIMRRLTEYRTSGTIIFSENGAD